MTTSGMRKLFGLACPRTRKKRSASIISACKMACNLLLLCFATAIASQAQTFRTLVLNSAASDTSLSVQGLDGNFYGTTCCGGVHQHGAVIQVTPGGVLTTIYSFCAQTNCIDGIQPNGLVQTADGEFYGTTWGGGAYEHGTVFQITRSGKLTTLHSFCAQTICADGKQPDGLVQGTDGHFYGTTLGTYGNAGTVFKITPTGVLTTLYSFCTQTGCSDGAGPEGLVQTTDGSVYGITCCSGTNGFSAGTVFKIAPAGGLTTLYKFCAQSGCPDGEQPNGLLQGTDGNLYGTTMFGGANNAGTVFKITPGGMLTTLYSFCTQTGCSDGANPVVGLLQSSDGNFYGTTTPGGVWYISNCPYGCGTVFKITQDGTLTTLHSFSDNDGAAPFGRLLQARSGTFYGTTSLDAWPFFGTIFSLCTGLGWFNEELPNYGKVGDTIDILGTNLTGASSVTFNGTATPFTVVSPTLIQATVPPGAGTGYVRVALPSGRIPSDRKFRVTPQITIFSPASGPVATVVTITGVSLSQTIWASIGGVGASFTVIDDTTMTATVPTGAKTGKVRITTRGGGATSATDFTVD